MKCAATITICGLHFFLALSPAHGQSRESPAEILAARVDSLRSAARFCDARKPAQQLVDARQADTQAKAFAIDDARRLVATLETSCRLSALAQRELANGYRSRDDVQVSLIQGKPADALRSAEEALRILTRYLGEAHAEVGAARVALGRCYWVTGRYKEAEAEYLRGISIQEKALGVNHPDVAQSLSRLARLYRDQGRSDEAESAYRRALKISEAALGANHPDTAKILNDMGVVYRDQGRFDEAEQLHSRALAILESALGPNDASVGMACMNLGIICNIEGKYAESEQMHLRALTIFKKALGPNDRQVGASLVNLGALYRDEGRLGEAEPMYLQAMRIFEGVYSPTHPAVAMCMNNLGVVYLDEGRYREAEPMFRRVNAIMEEKFGPDHPDLAQGLSNLAISCKAQKNYAEADSLYHQAIAIWRKNAEGVPHPNVAQGLSNLAGLYYVEGRPREMEQCYREALDILEESLGPESPMTALGMCSLAGAYGERGQYAKADSLLVRALDVQRKVLGEGHFETSQTLTILARLNWWQKKFPEAERFASEAYRSCSSDFRRNGIILPEYDALTYADRVREGADLCLTLYLADALRTPTLTRDVADMTIASKGIVSDGIYERRGTIVGEHDSTTVFLWNELQATKRQRSDLFVEGPGNDMKAYRARVDSLAHVEGTLEADLARRSSSFSRYSDTKNVTAERVAALLPKGAVLLEYVKFDYVAPNGKAHAVPRYAAVVITSGSSPVIVDLGEAADIDRDVASCRLHFARLAAGGGNPLPSQATEYVRISSSICDRVWTPVAAYVKKARIVLVAPDGALSLVSFGGLWDRREKKYLVEEKAIHYLSAGRDLIRYGYKGETAQGLLAMGMPDYGASVAARGVGTDSTEVAIRSQARAACGELSEIKWAPLPGTDREIKAVVASWKKGSREPERDYTGAEASEENFKAEAPGSRVIHVATHGYYLQKSCNPAVQAAAAFDDATFVGENPLLLSGLALAGANLHGKGANIAGAEDGILTAYEVAAMDLDGTEMVVLSGCETGLGKVEEGEGVYGLRRAFLMAGARTVVSTLWSVPDQETADMMGSLYADSDEPVYQRVRELQLRRIHELRRKHESDHPVSWAAFVVIGDPGSLRR